MAVNEIIPNTKLLNKKKAGMNDTPTNKVTTYKVNERDQLYPTLSELNCLTMAAAASRMYKKNHASPKIKGGMFSVLGGLSSLKNSRLKNKPPNKLANPTNVHQNNLDSTINAFVMGSVESTINSVQQDVVDILLETNQIEVPIEIPKISKNFKDVPINADILKEQMQCKLCEKNLAQVRNDTCNHKILCYQCIRHDFIASPFLTCPICESKLIKLVK